MYIVPSIIPIKNIIIITMYSIMLSQTIRKGVRDTIRATIIEDIQSEYGIKEEESIVHTL